MFTSGPRALQRHHYHASGDLPSKIQSMNIRLEESHIYGRNTLDLSADLVNMQEEMYYETMPKSSRDTSSIVNERSIYGRKDMKDDIVKRLLKAESSEDNYGVISLVENGGIGKTTLAQYVYNDHQLKHQFKLKVWVCVSDKVFDVVRVTTDIINSAIEEELTTRNIETAHRKLIEVVKGKKFLIVLDDVWNVNYNDWNKLQTPLQYGAKGSKIIVTTRNRNTTRMMSKFQNHDIINLEKLSSDDCWRLFVEHVYQVDNDLKKMKTNILRKCDGSPLAAKSLGGLFRKRKETSQRRDILANNAWSEEDGVLPVLKLSYFHLPPQLKPIFAYCSVLPKDYNFEEMEIILLWMAQGYLTESSTKRMEAFGHDYFLDLVDRSLFEHNPSNKNYYVMHDLVHDLSQWAVGDVCRCVMDNKEMSKELGKTRHLSLCTKVADQADQHMVPDKLQTFICQTKGYVDCLNLKFQDYISTFQCVRTLFLASETIEVLPKCIGDLKHLRYLNLEFPKIQELPQSVGKLCNLQTLFLIGCYNLREVTYIKNLVKLRHVRFHQSLWEARPQAISQLTNLQTLGYMYLPDDHAGNGSMIKELCNLNHLHGKLSVIGIQNVRKVEDADEVRLHEENGVEQLHLKWFGEADEADDNIKSEVLEKLKPNSCIKELELDSYMGLTLPSWLGGPYLENMVDIKLMNCERSPCLPPMDIYLH